MAPTRKSRSVNKRFTTPKKKSLVREVESGSEKQRKKKISDKLGPQWSKEELQRFYDAYRKYGKDWKKVASAVRRRTVDMVEALYTMNRAYLSLPEGTASVVGLIAMMTDHYSNMVASDSEQESNDGVGPSQKPQKRSRGKMHSGAARGPEEHFPDSSPSHAAPCSVAYLSLLRKKLPGATLPRAVGKRTPRIPVKYTYDRDNTEKYLDLGRQGSRLKTRLSDDDVAHKVALALAEASHRGGSPQTSHTPSKRTDDVVLSPARIRDRMRSESEMTIAKDVEDEMDEDDSEGSLGSKEADNGDLHTDISYHDGKRGSGASVVQRKGKKLNAKSECDIKEACSGTEEGKRIDGTKRKVGDVYAHSGFASSPGCKKRSKVLLTEDEGSDFDALQTLAALSSLMITNAAETETTISHEKVKVTPAEQASISEYIPANHRKEKSSAAVFTKRRGNLGVEASDSGTAKLREVTTLEVKETGTKQRRLKSPKPKSSEQGRNSTSRGKHSSQTATEQHQGLGVKIVDYSSSSTDHKRDGDESAASSQQTLATNQVAVASKVKSRRKLDRAPVVGNSEELKIANAFVNSQFDKLTYSYHHGTLGVKLQERLRHCLSNRHLRKWCVFEFFYSSVDSPWFTKSDFVDYLCHVGMGHVRRLTRVEWGVIRSSLGKPRRFSQKFLDEEKEKLSYYRESVRNHYTALRTGARDGLPTDLARPLTVGQCVIAIHPRTREVHNGSVLTVDHDRCRVQFDRHELGVEFVMDIDCMPSNPSENMPASLRRNAAVDKFYEYLKQMKPAERSEDMRKEVHSRSVPSQQIHITNGPSYILPNYLLSNSCKQGKEGLKSPSSQSKVGHHDIINVQQGMVSQSSGLAHIQAREADIRALAELSRVLDKKNALVTELKRMNDDVTEDLSLKDVESFKKDYAAILVQLDEVFEQVASALIGLRQRNTYHGSSSLLSQKSAACLNDRSTLVAPIDQSTSEYQDSGSHVSKIIETLRMKAQKMVDVAIQATSSSKDGEDRIKNAEDAIDNLTNCPSVDEPSASIVSSQLNGSPAPQNRSPAPELVSDHAPEFKLYGISDESGSGVPSELITNCVSMLLMIQKCSERQFPPADVAQILGFAVTGLSRSCSQNIPVHTEIQKCIGIIRSKILALVPR